MRFGDFAFSDTSYSGGEVNQLLNDVSSEVIASAALSVQGIIDTTYNREQMSVLLSSLSVHTLQDYTLSSLDAISSDIAAKCYQPATDNKLGGIKIGFSSDDPAQLPVQLDEEDRAYVEVSSDSVQKFISVDNDTLEKTENGVLKVKSLSSLSSELTSDFAQLSDISAEQWNSIYDKFGDVAVSSDIEDDPRIILDRRYLSRHCALSDIQNDEISKYLLCADASLSVEALSAEISAARESIVEIYIDPIGGVSNSKGQNYRYDDSKVRSDIDAQLRDIDLLFQQNDGIGIFEFSIYNGSNSRKLLPADMAVKEITLLSDYTLYASFQYSRNHSQFNAIKNTGLDLSQNGTYRIIGLWGGIETEITSVSKSFLDEAKGIFDVKLPKTAKMLR